MMAWLQCGARKDQRPRLKEFYLRTLYFLLLLFFKVAICVSLLFVSEMAKMFPTTGRRHEKTSGILTVIDRTVWSSSKKIFRQTSTQIHLLLAQMDLVQNCIQSGWFLCVLPVLPGNSHLKLPIGRRWMWVNAWRRVALRSRASLKALAKTNASNVAFFRTKCSAVASVLICFKNAKPRALSGVSSSRFVFAVMASNFMLWVKTKTSPKIINQWEIP